VRGSLAKATLFATIFLVGFYFLLSAFSPNFPVYPKPLPDRDLSYKADENEFTMVEKASLRNAWRLIEPFQRRFGKENFYRYSALI